eukprot:TRINITY_DN812_c0_g1_i8.p1 TRINITY_DN812_c0_g1~~TRINITY_DN812_c0_g1_i8.p1  ORF type:complete len:371 (-),score=79.76 TRINITY_DN812_c0_g1_i8:87-1085(-)
MTLTYRDEVAWRSFAAKKALARENQRIALTELQIVPILMFTNAKGNIDISAETASIVPLSGMVEYTVTYNGTFSEIMELQRFPFDRQLLHVNIRHDARKQPNIRLVWCQDPKGMMLKLVSADREWGSAHPSVQFPESKNAPDQELIAIGRAERFAAYFMWNIVFMMFLIVVMSFLTFTIAPEDGGSRLGLNLTLVLTAVAYKYVIAGYLPKTTYLTLLDKYVLVGFIILSSIIAENSAASAWDTPFAHTLDHYTEGIIIPFWLLLHLGVLIGSVTGRFQESWEKVDASQDTGEAPGAHTSLVTTTAATAPPIVGAVALAAAHHPLPAAKHTQ